MVLNKWPKYTARVKKAMSLIIKQEQVVCSGILTVGIQGQSPVHSSFPTSQLNTSLVLNAGSLQHQCHLH